jgi:hypothetical protein
LPSVAKPRTLPGFAVVVKQHCFLSGAIAARTAGMSWRALAVVSLCLAVVSSASPAGIPEAAHARLDGAKYVYVQSERKSGEWSKPAEIWFFHEGDAVYVATRPTSWRVRRIKAGRTKARIAVGAVDGPAYEATGALVKDAPLEQRLMDAYAKKYPDRWPTFADDFRKGFGSGDRVVVRYTPR